MRSLVVAVLCCATLKSAAGAFFFHGHVMAKRSANSRIEVSIDCFWPGNVDGNDFP